MPALLAAIAAAQQAPDPATLATIAGTVVNPGRLPVVQANVTLIGVPPNRGSYQATSDFSGRFSIPAVEPGRYSVMATHPDYAPYDRNLGTMTSPTIMTADGLSFLTVMPRQHKTDLDIVMVPMTILSGKVTDENGDPMPGVTVRPMAEQLILNGRPRIMNAGVGVKTGPDGTYRMSVYTRRWYLSFLPASSENKGAKVPAESGYATTYFPGLAELPQATPIEANGQPVPGLNIQLRKTPIFHVRGKITGGTILTDTRILAAHDTGNSRPSVVDEGRPVDPDGSFDIGGLTRGPWTLIICQYGKPGTFGRLAVNVAASDLDNISITMQPPADLTGTTVIVPESVSSDYPRNIRLTALEPLLGSSFTEPSKDNRFVIKNVEAGMYRLDLTPPPGGYVKSIILGGREYIGSGLDLTAGANSLGPLKIVVSMTAGEITGTVANPDGAPPTASVVTLVPDGPPPAIYHPELWSTATTDITGHFAFRSVVPGAYRVYAWEHLNLIEPGPADEPLAFPDPQFPRLFDSLSAVVTVAEKESKQVLLKVISEARMNAESRRRR